MKNKVKMFGFIALAAIITFGMAACNTEDDGTGAGPLDLTGTIMYENETSLERGTENARPGDKIIATYIPSVDEVDLITVNFQWNHRGDPLLDLAASGAGLPTAGGNQGFYHPYTIPDNTYGIIDVTLSAEGYNDTMFVECVFSVRPENPTDPLNFLFNAAGWGMKGSEQNWFQANSSKGTTYGYDETIVISRDAFIIEEFDPKKGGASSDKFVFSITEIEKKGDKTGSNWFALTGGNTTVSPIFTGDVYEITGSVITLGGYDSLKNVTTMYLYMNPENTAFVRTVTKDKNNKVLIGRVYKSNPNS